MVLYSTNHVKVESILKMMVPFSGVDVKFDTFKVCGILFENESKYIVTIQNKHPVWANITWLSLETFDKPKD